MERNPTTPNEQDAALRARITEAFPTVAVSEDLRQQLSLLREETRTEKPLSSWFARTFTWGNPTGRIAMGALAVAACCVFAAVVLTPARAIDRIQRALKDARSAHFTTFKVNADGTQEKADDLYYSNGRWRIENPLFTEVCSSGYCTVYYRRTNRIERRRADAPMGYQGWKGFSITSWKASQVLGMPKTGLDKVREATDNNGRHIITYRVTGELYPQIEQYILVDAKTDLPVGGEAYRVENGTKRLERVAQQEYNVALADSLFVPDFPKTATFVDLEKEKTEAKAYWLARIQKSIAQKENSGTRIVIRDFQTSASGDVFVLFTDGSKPGQESDDRLELTDDQGTKYLSPAQTFKLGPRESHTGTIANWVGGCLEIDDQTGKLKSVGMIVDGQSVLAAQLVPVSSGFKPTFPYHYTLSYRFDKSLKFDFTVEKPTIEVIPTYTPLMARPDNAFGIQYSDMTVRAAWKRFREGKKEEALALYNQILDQIREQEPEADGLISIYVRAQAETLIELNRPGEALRSLQALDNRTFYNKWESNAVANLKERARNLLH